jgi:hypothetical protein
MLILAEAMVCDVKLLGDRGFGAAGSPLFVVIGSSLVGDWSAWCWWCCGARTGKPILRPYIAVALIWILRAGRLSVDLQLDEMTAARSATPSRNSNIETEGNRCLNCAIYRGNRRPCCWRGRVFGGLNLDAAAINRDLASPAGIRSRRAHEDRDRWRCCRGPGSADDQVLALLVKNKDVDRQAAASGRGGARDLAG